MTQIVGSDRSGPGGNMGRPSGRGELARDAIRLLGDKWVPLVLGDLTLGPRLYGQLRATLGGIQESMLSRTLKAMERNGLVHREALPTAPPQCRYSLTDLGRSLVPILAELAQWTEGHLAEIEAARVQFESTVILRRAYS